MSIAKVDTAGRPVLLNLVAKGLVGGQTITLEDESGAFKIIAPSKLWEFISPGDQVCVTISPVKATVTYIEATPLPGLPRPLN